MRELIILPVRQPVRQRTRTISLDKLFNATASRLCVRTYIRLFVLEFPLSSIQIRYVYVSSMFPVFLLKQLDNRRLRNLAVGKKDEYRIRLSQKFLSFYKEIINAQRFFFYIIFVPLEQNGSYVIRIKYYTTRSVVHLLFLYKTKETFGTS